MLTNKVFFSTKTYTHEAGLSCTFRQHRSASHCSYLHGYALAVKFTFGAKELDDKGWVVDFGSLKDIKAYLADMFDHTTLVALDDLELPFLRQMADRHIINLRVVEATGCEAFAAMILDHTAEWLAQNYGSRCVLVSVEVSEHGGNSAICYDREAHAALSA